MQEKFVNFRNSRKEKTDTQGEPDDENTVFEYKIISIYNFLALLPHLPYCGGIFFYLEFSLWEIFENL